MEPMQVNLNSEVIKYFMFVKMIFDICKDNGIELTSISRRNIFRLSHNDVVANICNFNFDINSSASAEICKSKEAVHTILDKNNVPNVKHVCNHKDSIKGLYKVLADMLSLYGSVVVKPDANRSDSDIYIVDNAYELSGVLVELAESYDNVILSPYYDIKEEYNVVVLDGEVKLIYCKEKLQVSGDGERTILELLSCRENIDSIISVSTLRTDVLDYIPENGELVTLDVNRDFRYSSQSCVREKSDVSDEVITLAMKAVSKLRLCFAEVSIINVNNAYMVLNVHSDVNLADFAQQCPDNYDIAKGIYTDVIKRMLLMK